MYKCPHCNEPAISLFGKAWSGSASPARCGKCNDLSFVRSFWHVRPSLIAILILGAGLGATVLYSSVVYLAVAALSCVVVFAFHLHRETLVRTSRAQVAAGRPFAWVAVAVAAAILLFAAVQQGSAHAATTEPSANSASGYIPAATPNPALELTCHGVQPCPGGNALRAFCATMPTLPAVARSSALR